MEHRMSNPPKKDLIVVPPGSPFQRLLEDLQSGDIEKNRQLVAQINEAFSKPTIDNIWHADRAAVSHWLLLLNGINNADEQRLAQGLLFWREFFGGPDARIRCVQSSERDCFRFASAYFQVTSPPALIVSDDPRFTRGLKIDGPLLAKLGETDGALQRFLTKIHTQILQQRSIEEIERELTTEKFWNTVKVVYKETKGFFSIQISNT
jgi:hypothetical protein